MKSAISIAKSDYSNAFQNIQRCLSYIGEPQLGDNSAVVIKINICDARLPETGAITHPVFLDAVLRYLREGYQNLKIYVVESDASVVIADNFIKWFGYIPVLEKWHAEFINTSKCNIITTRIYQTFYDFYPIIY